MTGVGGCSHIIWKNPCFFMSIVPFGTYSTFRVSWLKNINLSVTISWDTFSLCSRIGTPLEKCGSECSIGLKTWISDSFPICFLCQVSKQSATYQKYLSILCVSSWQLLPQMLSVRAIALSIIIDNIRYIALLFDSVN